MSSHEELVKQFEIYLAENARFEKGGFSTCATRARKALMEITKLAKERRKEILDEKSAE